LPQGLEQRFPALDPRVDFPQSRAELFGLVLQVLELSLGPLLVLRDKERHNLFRIVRLVRRSLDRRRRWARLDHIGDEILVDRDGT
jgi:hypothetical protein